MVTADILKTLDIFEGLTDRELEEVSRISEIRECPKGTVIFRENEDSESLYLLLQGNVAINIEIGRHQEAIVHSVGAGEAFGWSALVQPYQFTASAMCVNNSRIVVIDRFALRKLIDLDCHMGFVIMEKLAELVSERLRDTRLQLISMLHG
jgi:CRP/FNR family cyclic AMP-dependent transcriptional regulator